MTGNQHACRTSLNLRTMFAPLYNSSAMLLLHGALSQLRRLMASRASCTGGCTDAAVAPTRNGCSGSSRLAHILHTRCGSLQAKGVATRGCLHSAPDKTVCSHQGAHRTDAAAMLLARHQSHQRDQYSNRGCVDKQIKETNCIKSQHC